MKNWLIFGLGLASQVMLADNLPVFSIQPTNQIVAPSNNITLVAVASGATTYQWRFNGFDIPWGTNSTLQLTNVQTTNSGYYMAVAKNAIGWAPSQIIWLSVVSGSGGSVELLNVGDTYSYGQAVSQITDYPISNGFAQVVAGPALDQMQPVGSLTGVTNGWYEYEGISHAPVFVPTVAPGQTVYYSVAIYYSNGDSAFTQKSTVLQLTAGGWPYSLDDTYGIKFPNWPEWPEPSLLNVPPQTNYVRIPSETVYFTNDYVAYQDFGYPTAQWRKDGNNISGATNFYLDPSTPYGGAYGGVYHSVLIISNIQPSDAGIYDAEIFGNNWLVSPKIMLNVQTTNGQGVFQNSSFNGTNFTCNLLGAAGRNYNVQWSSNLLNWSDLVTLSNVSGTITFTNSTALGNVQFYRTVLLHLNDF